MQQLITTTLLGSQENFILPRVAGRPILPTKHPERNEGCFLGKFGPGHPWFD